MVVGPGADAAPSAIVERFEIRARGDAFGGAAFGEVGAYERVDAVAHVSVDPAHAANREIADLALAPRDAGGRVAYDTDVVILRPRDPRRANRTLLFEVVPRKSLPAEHAERCAARRFARRREGRGRRLPLEAGLQRSGSGGRRRGRTRADERALPFATEAGDRSPAEFISRECSITRRPGRIDLLCRGIARPGARHDLRAPAPGRRSAFASAERAALRRRAQPRDRSPREVDAGAIYELVYRGGSARRGLRFAATRECDLVPAMADATRPELRIRSAGARPALAIGSRNRALLRDWAWQGFHVDGAGRPVFDGCCVHRVGAKNVDHAALGPAGAAFPRQHEDHRVPGNQFSVHYAVTTDPVTSRRMASSRAASRRRLARS